VGARPLTGSLRVRTDVDDDRRKTRVRPARACEWVRPATRPPALRSRSKAQTRRGVHESVSRRSWRPTAGSGSTSKRVTFGDPAIRTERIGPWGYEPTRLGGKGVLPKSPHRRFTRTREATASAAHAARRTIPTADDDKAIGGSTYQWYRADKAAGNGRNRRVERAGATSTYIHDPPAPTRTRYSTRVRVFVPSDHDRFPTWASAAGGCRHEHRESGDRDPPQHRPSPAPHKPINWLTGNVNYNGRRGRWPKACISTSGTQIAPPPMPLVSNRTLISGRNVRNTLHAGPCPPAASRASTWCFEVTRPVSVQMPPRRATHDAGSEALRSARATAPTAGPPPSPARCQVGEELTAHNRRTTTRTATDERGGKRSKPVVPVYKLASGTLLGCAGPTTVEKRSTLTSDHVR
jgi:hypothetical protein